MISLVSATRDWVSIEIKLSTRYCTNYIYLQNIQLRTAKRRLGQRQTACTTVKDEGLPQQAEVAQGVPGRLRPRIFLTFGSTGVVGRQPYAPAACTPGEIPGTHF